MRYLVFSVLSFLILTACTHQQSYREDTIRYFELNGTEKQYSDAIDQMYSMLKKQFSTEAVPDSVWEELQKNKELSLDEIKSLLVPVYKTSYTHEDIKALRAFYESDTGKQMLINPTDLTTDQKAKLSNFFSSEAGQKVQNQDGSLKSLVSDISISWSTSLYQETIQVLKTKGYELP